MRASVICEFNPFHNGHKFLLKKIKTEYADEIICIMSGSFVQRGDVSIIDKYEKTKEALKYSDCIIELPTIFANANAETFAKKGVEIAKSTNSDYLIFGVTNTDIDTLESIVDIINTNECQELVKAKIESGENYPTSLSFAIDKISNSNLSEVIKDSNNILAIEYIKACRIFGIKPIGIKRIDSIHDTDIKSDNIASASYIRNLIEDNKEYINFTDILVSNPANIENIENAIIYKLRSMKADDIEKISDVTEGLENRIIKSCKDNNSLKEIIASIKTKRYTESRIRRILISCLLDITKDIQNNDVKYLRILGIKSNKTDILKSFTLPLITNVKSSYDKLDEQSKMIFDIDVKASEIYTLSQKNKEMLNDFKKSIIKE